MLTERIAYLCGEYPRATDTSIQREVAALRSADMHVRTISIRRPAARERLQSNGATPQSHDTYYVLPAGFWRLATAHWRTLMRSPRRYLRALRLALSVRSPGLRALTYQLFYFAEAAIVAELMRREGLVHLHNHAPDASGYVAMIAAEMGGFSYSMTIHGHGILAEPGRWRLADKLRRALFVVCVSWHARSQCMLWSSQDTWDRFHVIHCGVTSERRELRQHTGSGTRLLYVGRLDHVKGLPLLIDALASLADSHPDIRVDIVGDGPERPSLEQRVAASGLNAHVHFHGYLGQHEVEALLAQSDALVMTSFAEGIPVALMEAMAVGVPVVAPRITGIPELIEHQRGGLLFTPGNVDDLVGALLRLLDDPDLRSEFAEHGYRTIREQFNLGTETGRLVALMRGRLAGKPMPVRPEPQSDC